MSKHKGSLPLHCTNDLAIFPLHTSTLFDCKQLLLNTGALATANHTFGTLETVAS